mgnify:CR=1 FL=1
MEFELPSDVVAQRPALAEYEGRSVAIGIRPEDVREAAGWDGARLRGRILLVESLGSEQLVHIEIAGDAARGAPISSTPPPSSQAPPWVSTNSSGAVTLLGRFDRHLLLAPGEAVEVAIDPRLLHFFDLETASRSRRSTCRSSRRCAS